MFGGQVSPLFVAGLDGGLALWMFSIEYNQERLSVCFLGRISSDLEICFSRMLVFLTLSEALRGLSEVIGWLSSIQFLKGWLSAQIRGRCAAWDDFCVGSGSLTRY